ncbi:hypothetical protein WN944_009930 [Citrus x changshan-huyou]|uniref:Uncharacterized protein n=1 Tax=Citrus x changshan-huyou TaxID=2935761 RepID=A0AAP0R076_9ROSI
MSSCFCFCLCVWFGEIDCPFTFVCVMVFTAIESFVNGIMSYIIDFFNGQKILLSETSHSLKNVHALSVRLNEEDSANCLKFQNNMNLMF